jgi:hypothetical protein
LHSSNLLLHCWQASSNQLCHEFSATYSLVTARLVYKPSDLAFSTPDT